MRQSSLILLVIAIAILGSDAQIGRSVAAQSASKPSAPRSLRIVPQPRSAATASEGAHDYFNKLKARREVMPIATCSDTAPQDNGACSLRNQAQLQNLQATPQVYPKINYKTDWKNPLCYRPGGTCDKSGDPFPEAQDAAKMHFWPQSMPACSSTVTSGCIPTSAPRCYDTPASDAPPACSDGNLGLTGTFLPGSSGHHLFFRFPSEIANGSALVTFDIWYSCSWVVSAAGSRAVREQIGRMDAKFAPWGAAIGTLRWRHHPFYTFFTHPSDPGRVATVGMQWVNAGLNGPKNEIASEELRPLERFESPCGEWIRVWSYVRMQAGAEYEAGCATKDTKSCHEKSKWSYDDTYMASESMPPHHVNVDGPFKADFLEHFEFEFDSSGVQRTWTNGDLILYLRNMVFLRNPPSNWTDPSSGIGLIQPVQ